MLRLRCSRVHGCCFVTLTAALALLGGEARADNLAWGTYYGGEVGDYVWGVAVDATGNIYIAGQTQSFAGIATPGAHKTVPELTEGYLAKFTPSGERLWGTYFGGPGEDWILALVVRGDSVVVSGETYSTAGIAFGDTFQTTANSNHNGFVAQFTGDGELEWATYIRTNLVVEGVAVPSLAVGEQGELYVAGSTLGGTDLASPDAHQPLFAGGAPDAFLMRLDDTGNRVWGTYYGGHAKESGAVTTRDGVVFLGGFTQSEAAIATPGTFQPDAPGDDEKFGALYVAAFDPDGVRAWGTYFGSTVGKDFGAMAAYPGGGVVLGGSSQAVDVGQSTDMSEPSGSDDGILVRFDATGNRVWSRYYGGEASDGVKDIVIDDLGTIHVCGYTFSDGGIATPDGYQTVPNDIDLFLARFDGEAQQSYGTYLGGESSDSCGKLALAPQRVLVGGRTRSMTGIATPNAHQTLYNLGMEDGVHGDGFLQVFGAGLGAGDPCRSADACQSGFCSDGVCCDTACGDGDLTDCQACSTAEGAAVDGTCGPRAPTTCRPAVDECDAPEACDGRALECPADDAAADGTPCTDGLCAAGMCTPDDTTGSTSTDPDPDTTQSGGELPTGSDDTGVVPTSDGPATTQGPDSSSGEATGNETPTDTGCGCATTTPNTPALLALVLLAPRRRRHHRPARR